MDTRLRAYQGRAACAQHTSGFSRPGRRPWSTAKYPEHPPLSHFLPDMATLQATNAWRSGTDENTVAISAQPREWEENGRVLWASRFLDPMPELTRTELFAIQTVGAAF